MDSYSRILDFLDLSVGIIFEECLEGIVFLVFAVLEDILSAIYSRKVSSCDILK
jgi:hypothetical protein